MKKIFLTFLTAGAFVLGSSLFISCGGNKDAEHSHEEGETHEHTDSDEHQHNEATEEHTETEETQTDKHVYSCPMHPEITGKDGDKCSTCEMDLVMEEHDHEEEGHADDGHEH